MKNIGHFALIAILALTLSSAFADWEYVETSGTSFNQSGSGYLKDENSSWQVPATRSGKTYNLTVDFSTASDINPLIQSEEPVVWDFTTVKTTTVKDKPETLCPVVTFKGCSGINIAGLIAPDCEKLGNTIFLKCTELKSIYLPKCTYLGQGTFAYCTSLETIDIPEFSTGHSSTRGSVELFCECTALKELTWNFPMTVLYGSMFDGCSSLKKVVLETPITEFRGSVFQDIAPGAEIYMHSDAPSAIGENAFSNTKNGATQRIYLQDNYDAWLAAFRQNHHVILLSNIDERAAFNAGWQSDEPYSGTKYRTRAGNVIPQMQRDPDICTVLDDDNQTVRFHKKGLLAFAMRKHSGTGACYGCWIFKVPETGFQISVR